MFILVDDEKSLLDSNVPPDTILRTVFRECRIFSARRRSMARPFCRTSEGVTCLLCLQVSCTRKSRGTPTRAYTAGTNRCWPTCVWVQKLSRTRLWLATLATHEHWMGVSTIDDHVFCDGWCSVHTVLVVMIPSVGLPTSRNDFTVYSRLYMYPYTYILHCYTWVENQGSW
jgi:hypothetical protein